jgi:hypothetical protein
MLNQNTLKLDGIAIFSSKIYESAPVSGSCATYSIFVF